MELIAVIDNIDINDSLIGLIKASEEELIKEEIVKKVSSLIKT